MSFVNQFELLNDIMQGKKPDSVKLLSGFDRNALFAKLRKTKQGLPKPFEWTDSPIEEKNFEKILRRDKERLQDIVIRIHESTNEQLPKLLEFKDKYPNVPAIRNYISGAYFYSKQEKLYFETLMETVDRFPDYLFGKVSLADYYLKIGEYKKIPEVLNHKFEIHMHFSPSFRVFHVSEVRAFHSVLGRYCIRTNKPNRALFCFMILYDTDPSHISTKMLADEIILREIENLKKKFPKRKKR